MWPLIPVIGFGAFGGVSPTLMKLASAFVARPEDPMPAMLFYVGVGLYAILGSGIAVALGEQTFRGALFAGIAAPALISNAIAGAQTPTTPPSLTSPSQQQFSPQKQNRLPSIFPQAFAEGVSKSVNEGADNNKNNTVSLTAAQKEAIRKLVQSNNALSPRIVGIVGINKEIDQFPVPICFIYADAGQSAECKDSRTIAAMYGNSVTFAVPKDAVGVAVAGEPIILDKQTSLVGVRAETKAVGMRDFLWALGGKRTLDITGLEAAELQ